MDLAEARLALGRSDDAAGRLSALLAEHPADERVAALLMDALASQGRQAEALQTYERVRATLADLLGADPGAALRERHLCLLRFADSPHVEAPSNLPIPLTSFIGRDEDLTRVDMLLARGRLVTVLGPGGAGKTRLAVEAGRRHRHEYPDGTWLVDLASVTACPSTVDPGRNHHRTGERWTLRTVAAILANPRYTGRQVWNRQRTDVDTIGCGPDWVISKQQAHTALVTEQDFVATQAIRSHGSTRDGSTRSYLLTGLLRCGPCGRRMEAH
ncbi:BTAD domain-containing putative transcriptional regulator [Micromonospora lupini]|uniref:BTAD domain-containing putative transcriptional regulator n=1 Tax=Micromonospora lupini TaxID=285679 RepID=UPI003409A674